MTEASPPLIELLGGEPVLRRVVDRFYDEMDQLEGAATIRAMHPKSLAHSREKLFDFLVGWTGGEQRYIAKRGHPRMRMRHMPFAIDLDARDAWLTCMSIALEAEVPPTQARQHFWTALVRLADHMRNQAEPASS